MLLAMSAGVPYLLSVKTIAERLPEQLAYPFDLPFVKDLSLTIRKPITFFVGENGTGKSTLIEATAALCGFPVSGGSRSELAEKHGPEQESALASVLRPAFRRWPRDGYFLRAEFQGHFASLLDARSRDPDFWEDPYASYGGRSLHERSHGEAFLAIVQNRIREGLFLLDESESALSPQRQLALLLLMHDLTETGKSQFIIATHSPILMTFPGAEIISFDQGRLCPTTLEETTHYQITRGILEHPDRYLKPLFE